MLQRTVQPVCLSHAFNVASRCPYIRVCVQGMFALFTTLGVIFLCLANVRFCEAFSVTGITCLYTYICFSDDVSTCLLVHLLIYLSIPQAPPQDIPATSRALKQKPNN